MGKQQFASWLAERGIRLTEKQLVQFDAYFHMLVEWNEKMNLTAITEEDEVYVKHFYDSITAAFTFPVGDVKTLIDIGAGAGFPSLPLKICFPHLQITIVDSLQKRILFLSHLVQELQLDGVTLKHGRAEEVGRETAYREAFDLVTARAVARLNILAEYCLPFARIGGHFLAMKGADLAFELQEAKKAIKILGGKTKKVELLQLPEGAGERNLVWVEKIAATPAAYPRKPGLPAKKPLV